MADLVTATNKAEQDSLRVAWDGPASGPRGGSLVLPPRPGWRDLAGRCWHARPPAASPPPTNPALEPSPLGSLDRMADFVGSTACPLGSLGMPGCPPSPGSKGRADRPARQQEGAGP